MSTGTQQGRTDGLAFLVQKQLTENDIAEQKANVAAMRADVTVDTTQIGHKILRQVTQSLSDFPPASPACWLA